jgi:hypothetical protein
MEGGVEKGVLGREEGGAAQFRAAHDMVLELLQLLQVGGLEGGVQVGRRARAPVEKVCKKKIKLYPKFFFSKEI